MKATQKGEQRFESRVSIDIILNKYIKGRPYLCRASNLSRRGIFVHRVNEPQHLGKNVGLQFQVPGDERVITCAGEVVHEHDWVDADGILFTSIAPEHQKIIDDYITNQLDWSQHLQP